MAVTGNSWLSEGLIVTTRDHSKSMATSVMSDFALNEKEIFLFHAVKYRLLRQA